MTKTEVLQLLEFIATVDGRPIEESDMHVWFQLLAPIDFDRALNAAQKHFRSRPDVRIKPGHIWELAVNSVDPRDTLKRLAESGGQVECHKCNGVHFPTEDCSVLVPAPDDFWELVEMYRSKKVGREPRARKTPKTPSRPPTVATAAEPEQRIFDVFRTVDEEGSGE